MRQRILTFMFFSCFLGTTGNAFSGTESGTPARYFAECHVFELTDTSADVSCEALVLLESSDRRNEQIAMIHKQFSAAQELEVQVDNSKEKLKAVLLNPPDENLRLSLRRPKFNRQVNVGEVIQIKVFICGT